MTAPTYQSVDLLIPDLNASLRGKRIDGAQLPSVLAKGVYLPASVFALDYAGATIESTGLGLSTGDRDLPCSALAQRLTPATRTGRGQMLLTMQDGDGAPFWADPRHQLQRVLDAWYTQTGLTPVVAVELEFYLLDAQRDGDRLQKPLSPRTGQREANTQVYSLEDLDTYASILDDITAHCAAQHIPATTAIGEYAPAQFEVNLQHKADIIAACDDAILLKNIVRQVARHHGLDATFMAKPFAEDSGSGLHLHLSMIDGDGVNAFRYDGEPNPLMAQAMAGMMALMNDSMALFAPTVNAYKRLAPDMYAPLSPSWDYDNRSVALRIPRGSEGSARIEHRVAGADANPYLCAAAMLAGALHGVQKPLSLPARSSGNAGLAAREFATDLSRAADALEASAPLRAVFSDQFIHHFVLTRRHEWDTVQAPVSHEEILRYQHL